MRPLLLASILLATVAASAQTRHAAPQPVFPTPSVQSDPLIPPTPSSSICPESITASRRGQPVALWTISHEDASDPAIRRKVMGNFRGSGLHVQLEPSRFIQMPPTILRAELSVDYLAPATRVLPVSARYQPPTLSKTFTVHAGDLPAYKLAADLLIGQTSGILRVHLVSVEYTNGESWVAPTPDACTATPSLYVPVSN